LIDSVEEVRLPGGVQSVEGDDRDFELSDLFSKISRPLLLFFLGFF